MSSDAYDGPFSRERLKQYAKSQGAALGPGRAQGLPSGVGAATQPLGAEGFSQQRLKEFATGRNLEGQQNGWNTQFMSSFVQNYNKAIDKGENPINWFRDKKDGIALWDDEPAGIKFGDVFQGGRKIENIYDTMGKDVADEVMRPLVMDGRQAMNGVTVESRRQANTQQVSQAREVQQNKTKYESELDKVYKEMDESLGGKSGTDATTAGFGVAGGAITGAGIGSLFPGIGTAIGAGVGAVVGGIGGWMNRDTLQESYARSEAITRIAFKEENQVAGWSKRAQGFGGLAMQGMDPLGNVVEGLADTEGIGWGHQGDRENAYNAIDPNTGKPIRNMGWTVARTGAALGSAIPMLGSKTGVRAYQAAMGTSIGGSVTELAATGGKSWDDEAYGFDKVYLDDDGKFSAISTAAAALNIGVDAVQLGGAGSLVRAGRALTGKTAKVAGDSVEKLAGMKFTVKDGVAVRARSSFASMMAPSETVAVANVRLNAMLNRSGGAKGALKPDELYQAALRVSNNSKTIPTALVNGFGEGLEEGLQAVLEPLSHNNELNGREIMDAALRGFGMGAGMGIGTRMAAGSYESRALDRANGINRELNEPEFSKAEWAKMPEVDKKTFFGRNEGLSAVMEETAKTAIKDQTRNALLTDPALARRQVALENEHAAMASKGAPATDQAMTIRQADVMADDRDVQFSLNTALSTYKEMARGLAKGIEEATLRGETELAARLKSMQGSNQTIQEELSRAIKAFYASTATMDEQQKIVKQVNAALQGFWAVAPGDQKSEERAQATMILSSRSPSDNPNSVVALRPRIDLDASIEAELGSGKGRGDSALEVTQGTLQSTGGDFDGDKYIQLARMLLDGDTFQKVRSGVFMRGTEPGKTSEGRINIGTSPLEGEILEIAGIMHATGNKAEKQKVADLVRRIQSKAKRLVPGTDKLLKVALDRLEDDIQSGASNAKDVFFDNLDKLIGNKINERSMETYENLWFEMNTTFRQAAWTFQQSIAASRSREKSKQLKDTPFSPVDAKTMYGRTLSSHAATVTQTLWTEGFGNAIFRLWQSLTYSKRRSPEVGADGPLRSVFDSMSAAYVAASSGDAESQLDMLGNKDRLYTKVIARLQTMADQTMKEATSFKDVTMLANLRVPRLEFNDEGALSHEGDQSVLQWLLDQAIREEEQILGGAVSDQDRSKFLRLRSASAEEAFIEVYSSRTMAQLLGVDADVFGAGRTLQSVYTEMRNADSDQRQANADVLKSHASYLWKSKEEGFENIPYTVPKDGKKDGNPLTPYQSVVDTLLGAVNKSISLDINKPADQQLRGSLAEASHRVSASLLKAFDQTAQSMKQMNVNRKSREEVAGLLRESGIAMELLNAFSDTEILYMVDVEGNLSNFVVDSFMAKTAQEFEMTLYRGLLLAGWNAVGRTKLDDGSWSGRDLYSLKDRMHLLMFRLAQPGMEVPLTKFMKQLNSAKNVHEFIAFVNNPHNLLLQNEAPLTAWNTDIAAFDPTWNEGSLTKQLPGTERALGFSALADKTGSYIRYLNDVKRMDRDDTRAIKAMRDPNSQDGVAAKARLQKRLDFIADFRGGVGPRAIYQMVMANLLGLTNATDKGKAPVQFENVASIDALLNSAEFGTPEQALMASITSNTMAGAGRDAHLFVDNMTLMADDGSLIEWDGMDADKFLDLWDTREARPFLRSLLAPTVMDVNDDGGVSQKYIGSVSVADNVGKNDLEKRMHSGSTQDRMLQLSMIDARTPGHDAVIYAGKLAAALTSGLGTPIQSADDAGRIATKAMATTAELAMSLAPLYGIVNTKSVTVRDPDVIGGQRTYTPKNLLEYVTAVAYDRVVRRELDKPLGADLRALQQLAAQEIQKTTNAADPVELQEAADRLERLMGLDSNLLLKKVHKAYGFDVDPKNANWRSETIPVRKRLIDVIDTQGQLLAAAPFSKPLLAAVEGARNSEGVPELSHAQWSELSMIVMSFLIQQEMGAAVPGSVLLPLTGTSYEDLRLFDPTYKWLIDDLLGSESPIMKAAVALTKDVTPDAMVIEQMRAIDLIESSLMKEGLFGKPSDPVVVNVLQFSERVYSGGAKLGVSAAGNIPPIFGAPNGAANRTTTVPDEALLSMVLYASDKATVERPDKSTNVMGELDLQGRAVKEMVISLRGTDLDIQTQLNLNDMTTTLFLGTDEAATSGYRFLSPERLEGFIEGIVKDNPGSTRDQVDVRFKMFHPDDQPIALTNNVFFEGTLPEGDVANASLPGIGMAGVAGIMQKGTSKALDAGKKGTLALSRPEEIPRSQVEILRTGWRDNLPEAIRRLTAEMFREGRLGGARGADTWNSRKYVAMVKHMQMRHVVRIPQPDGTFQVMSFEEAREMQRTTPLPAEAELIGLSDKAMSKLYGQYYVWSNEGKKTVQSESFRKTDVVPWTGKFTEAQQKQLPGLFEGKTATPFATPLRGPATFGKLPKFDSLTMEQKAKLTAGFTLQSQRAYRINQLRQKELTREQVAEAALSGLRVVDYSDEMSTMGAAFARLGLDFSTQDSTLNQLATELSVADRTNWKERAEQRLVHVYRDARDPSEPLQQGPGALYGYTSLQTTGETVSSVALEDVVIVDLDSFGENDTTAVNRVMSILTGYGADVVLATRQGNYELQQYAGALLRDRRYRLLPGASNVYVRDDERDMPVTERALQDELTVSGAVDLTNTRVTFMGDNTGVGENTVAILDDRDSIPMLTNTIIDLNFGSFGLPQPDELDSLRRRLQDNQDEILDQAVELALGKFADFPGKKAEKLKKGEERAIRQGMLDALRTWDATVDKNGLPAENSSLSFGDLIVLTKPGTEELMLYRFGHEAPKYDERVNQLTSSKIAMYKSKLDPNVSAHEGQIYEIMPIGQGRLRLLLQIDAPVRGGKIQWNGAGFKGLMTKIKGLRMPRLNPSTPLFAVVSDIDAAGKSFARGRMNNFQTAITYLGMDLRPELAKFFFKSDDPVYQGQVASLLQTVRSQIAFEDLHTVDMQMKGFHSGMTLLEMVKNFGTIPELMQVTDWNALAESFGKGTVPVEEELAVASLIYLTYQGSNVQDVLGSVGFNTTSVGVRDQAWKPAALFTQALDNGSPQLREHLMQKLQENLPSSPHPTIAGKKIGYVLEKDFRVSVVNENPQYSGVGWLQFGEAWLANTSTATDQESFDRTDKQGTNEQLQEVVGAPTGMRLTLDTKLEQKWADLNNRDRYMSLSTAGEVYSMLRDVRVGQSALGSLQQMTAREREYILEGRQIAKQWRRQLNTDAWTKGDIRAYKQARKDIALGYGLLESEAHLVDTWVRQQTGRQDFTKKQLSNLTPAELEELLVVVNPSFDVAMRNLEIIAQNLGNNLLPTVNASVPLLHSHDLLALHRGATRNNAFALVKNAAEPSITTTDWKDWVHIALSVGDTTNEYFHPAFLTSTDAMLHSYRDAGIGFTEIPVSSDPDRREGLLLDDLMSTSPGRAKLLKMEESRSVTWGDPALEAAIAERTRRMYHWSKTNAGGAVPTAQTQKDMVKHGSTFVDRQNSSAAIFRIATNMRATLALLNPLLIPGALIEGTMQLLTDGIAGVLTGQATKGPISPYSSETRKGIRLLASGLGDNAVFRSHLYADLAADFSHPGAGRVEKLTAKTAKFAGMLQDPYYGMTGNKHAHIYLANVLANVQQLGNATTLTADEVILQLQDNPLWVAKNHPALDQMALNQIKDVKCVRDTFLSVLWKHHLNKFTNSPKMRAQIPGVLVKLQFMFATYGIGNAIRLMGLQGADAWLTAMMTGREKGSWAKFINKTTDALTGQENTWVDGEEIYDFTSTLVNIDITRSVVRSGVTLSSIFALGLMMGGLGLSGEDEEDRRKRRMAKLQGVPLAFDPLDPKNDFRNADAIYFDNIPFLSEIFRVTPDDEENGVRGRSMAEMNFLVKQVASPLLGMSRFFDNGDPREVLWGFQDAISSLPLVNTMDFDSASKVYMELMEASAEKAEAGGPEALPQAYYYMVAAFANLERMLLESSFVNQLYVSSDTFDRDPWKLVEKDAQGMTVTDRLGNPGQTGALEEVLDPETGEIVTKYKTQDPFKAHWYNLTEKRLGLALVTELFSLGHADALRRDMAIKTQKMRFNQMSMEEATAIMRTLAAGGNPEDLHLGNAYLSYDQRVALEKQFKLEKYNQLLATGLDPYKANYLTKLYMDGDWTTPDVPGMRDIIWSQKAFEGLIPTSGKAEYMQLNTSYVQGPDGNFWATGVSRQLLATMGGFAPFVRYLSSEDTGMGSDQRLNSTDFVRDINTGMRGLTPIHESFAVPEPDDSGYVQYGNNANNSKNGNGWVDYGNGGGWRNFGSRWRNFRRGGWRNFGRGGGGGGGYATRINAPQDNMVPYANSAQNVNASNPIIRRATIRRERSDSEKGRLKPWQ